MAAGGRLEAGNQEGPGGHCTTEHERVDYWKQGGTEGSGKVPMGAEMRGALGNRDFGGNLAGEVVVAALLVPALLPGDGLLGGGGGP